MFAHVFGHYAAYIIPAYGVSAAVILGMIVVTRMQYRQRLKEIEALEKQGVGRRSKSEGKPGK
ncbi:MAG: heme exporter protein CcmD [Salaquimonas sp.]|jgi:heme exporter protein CcmD|nr:heme exporter protein CcmD [Salaquimonas sp.]